MTKSAASQSFSVLECRVDRITMTQAVSETERMITERRKDELVFCTVSTVLSARKDARLRKAIEHAALVAPDGMPLVWLGKRFGGAGIERVYGPDFMLAFMSATGGSYRHFFFGGAEGVADALQGRLTRRFPSLQVVGAYSPPFSSSMTATTDEVELINACRPDIVWVGLGHPKQEIWGFESHPHLDVPVIAAVGAAFDFHAGVKKEAPRWMQRSGLQWLHRVVKEPRRLWKRYLIGNTLFVVLIARDLLRGRLRRGSGLRG